MKSIFFLLLKNYSDGDIPNAPGGESASTSTADSHQLQAMESGGPLQPLRTRSKSDPLLHHSVERGEATPQTPLRARICLQVPGGSGGGRLWLPRTLPLKSYFKGG